MPTVAANPTPALYRLEERDGALVFVVHEATCPYCDGSGEVLMCGELWPCKRCK